MASTEFPYNRDIPTEAQQPALARPVRIRRSPFDGAAVAIMGAAITALLLAGVVAFALSAYAAVHCKGELDYGEGVVLWQAQRVTDWKTAYHRIESPPYIVFHYPPVYHLAARAMALATGDLLAAGRLVSAISLAGACAVMAFLAAACVRRAIARYIAALVGATFIFTLPTWPWASTMRVDTLGLFFEIAGVALFVFALRRPALAFASFALFVAAVFSKQSLIAGPAACLAVAFLERPPRAWQLLAFAAAVSGAAVATLQYLTNGAFLVNVVRYNANHFSMSRLMFFAVDHFGAAQGGLAAPLVFAGIGAFWILGRRMPAGFQPRAWAARMRAVANRGLFGRALVTAFLFLCFAAAATVSAGKTGSNFNYFFEMDLALTLLCALVAGGVATRARFRIYGFALPVLYALVALHSLHTLNAVQTATLRPAEAGKRARELASLLAKAPQGPVYSEAMVASLQAGRELIAEPAIISALALGGAWDETPFVRDLEQGRIAAVLITSSLDIQERFSPRVKSALERGYDVVASTPSGAVLLRPKFRPDVPASR